MGNPYKDNLDKIQALVRRLSREHMYTTIPELRYMGDSSYGMNFVSVSGGEPFDADLEEQLADLMKEVTDDDSDSETV